MATFGEGFVTENARNLDTKGVRPSDLIPLDAISAGVESSKLYLLDRQRTESFSQVVNVC